ncbi:MAG: DUF1553 domain-containing protein [Cyclobacteriaceae bacterium]
MRLIVVGVIISVLFVQCGQDLPEEVTTAFASLPEVVDYNIHVKPILSDRCYHCHGPDEETRAAGLRFDTREGLFAKSEFGNKPFAKGSLSKSAVINRILSDDPEIMMPPPKSHRALDAKEKAVLIKWVEDGAVWKEHWSFNVPEKPRVPALENNWRRNNEIDYFIQDELLRQGLKPSEKADKERLLRRVTMDLTGLPPSIEEMDAFLNDTKAGAYELVVDRLLSTKAHAERLTLEWLDVARYSDSHGFHADGERKMWPWRDWVIEAFAQNMPYDQFVTEQLAGDLMTNPTKDQVIATAFNRNHPMTAEGGAVEEEFRLEYVSNRTNTFGTAFLGLTLECAKCHDHKFDPISQREYYQVSSFFNNIKELGMTGDDGDFGPMLMLTNEEADRQLDFLKEEIEAMTKQEVANELVEPILQQSFDKKTKGPKDTYSDNNPKFIFKGDIELVDGIAGKAPLFDHQDNKMFALEFGQFEAYDPFSIGIWVNPSAETGKTKVLIGNAGDKNSLWRGWDFYLDSSNHVSLRLINTLPHNLFHVVSEETIPFGEWTHLLVTYDGSMSGDGVDFYVDGERANSRVLYNRLYKSILPTRSDRSVDTGRALQLGRSYRSFTGDNGIYKGLIDELVIYDRAIVKEEAVKVMELSTQGESPRVKALRINQELQTKRREKLLFTDTIPELMVMEEMAQPRPTYVLKRGEYDKPTDEVTAGTIAKVLPFDDQLKPNRLGLSGWLFDQNNPLTARVAVNRYWQMIFGQGIVTTVNDFGSQGALPSHPALLDWLAVSFIENDWDLKWLLKTMVMSETYQQSSHVTEELFEVDASNTYLARGPSYRLQAEMIRDNALAASGLLVDRIGGASVRPYQPEGLWIELGNFSHFLRNFKQDHDDNQYRRSMYTFVRRTSPPPNMMLFDAPNREVCTVTRERTNTPLQALVLLNDPQFVEASKALACRVLQDEEKAIDVQIEKGFRLALSRTPTQAEIGVLHSLYQKAFNEFKENRVDAEEYLAIGDFEVPEHLDELQVAAMSVVSNTLLNMDEAYTKR